MFQITANAHPLGFPPVSQTLPQVVAKIVESLKPEKIVLFGSYAYGTPTSDSDVDLLLVMRTSATEKERYLAVSRLPGSKVPRLHPRWTRPEPAREQELSTLIRASEQFARSTELDPALTTAAPA